MVWTFKFGSKALWIVVLASWGLAFFEYCFQVPANRIGNLHGLTVGQLKIMQECITLVVFVVFVRLYFGDKLGVEYIMSVVLLAYSLGFSLCFIFSRRGGCEGDAIQTLAVGEPVAVEAEIEGE